MSSTASQQAIYAGKKNVIYYYCHLLKSNNCERLHTTTEIKIAVHECKIPIVNKKKQLISLPTKTLHGILTSLKFYNSDHIARVY